MCHVMLAQAALLQVAYEVCHSCRALPEDSYQATRTVVNYCAPHGVHDPIWHGALAWHGAANADHNCGLAGGNLELHNAKGYIAPYMLL